MSISRWWPGTIFTVPTEPEDLSAQNIQSIENFWAVEKLLLKLVPPETAFLILDYAEFWVKQRFVRSDEVFFGTIDHYDCSMLYLQTAPIGYGGRLDSLPILQPRKIIFHLRSWANGVHNYHTTAYPYKPQFNVSWFDVSIFRRDPKSIGKDIDLKDFDPRGLTDELFPNPDDEQLDRLPRWLYDKGQLKGGYMVVPNGSKNRWWLQGNKFASGFLDYEVVWTLDANEQIAPIGETGRGDGEGFVEAIRRGDIIAVWARTVVSTSHGARSQITLTTLTCDRLRSNTLD